MRWIPCAAQRWIIRGIVLSALAAMPLPVSLLRGESPQVASRPTVRLPDEPAGIDAIVRALIGAYDQVDILALGEAHLRKMDSDLRIALVRHPDFAKRARTIVIECASASEHPTLDRYIRGEIVSETQLERVWKTLAGGSNGFCDAPMYADFLAAVRDVNSKLPADDRVRILGGDPRSRESASLSVLKAPVLQKHGKALLIYGAAHFYLTGPPDYLSSHGNELGIAGRLDLDYPGRWLAIIPIGGVVRPPALKEADIDPDYQKFDRALKARGRPVLVSLQRPPFRDFMAEEFLGRTLITCRGSGGCRSVFKGSTLKLGQMADVGVYVGPKADAAVQAKPSVLWCSWWRRWPTNQVGPRAVPPSKQLQRTVTRRRASHGSVRPLNYVVRRTR
jgi:hypothetical protein